MKRLSKVAAIARLLRAKLTILLRFLELFWALAKRPSATASQIVLRKWPAGMPPKTFASMALVLLVVCSLLNPVISRKASWVDAFFEMPPNEQEKFMEIFDLSGDDIYMQGIIEQFRPYSTLDSQKIFYAAQGISTYKIAAFLQGYDVELSESFSKSVEVAGVELDIRHFLFEFSVLPLFLLQGLVYHWIVKPKTVSTRESVNLTLCFSGFYSLIFSVLLIIRKIFEIIFRRENSIENYAFLLSCVNIVCCIIMLLLTIQFCVFMNAAHKSSIRRVFAAIVISNLVYMVSSLLLFLFVGALMGTAFVHGLIYQIPGNL